MAGLKRRIRRLLKKAGLLWTRRRDASLRRRGAADGLPIPSAELIQLVAGTEDVAWYLECGKAAFECFRRILGENGGRFDGLESVLDFGCGCGRVMRHWQRLSNVRVFGTDINRDLSDWSRANLPFAEVRTNDPMPPTDFGDEDFDLVYALSVFTHLPQEAERAWIDELSRILKPGGHLIITTHGERCLAQLDDKERGRFEAGEVVVKRKGPVGSNAFGVYHPPDYVRAGLAPGLELIAFEAGGVHQDVSLFRKPSCDAT